MINPEHCPREDLRPITNVDLLRQAIDEVVGQSIYTPDYDFDIFYRLQELEEQNGLPDGMTAESLMQDFYRVFNYDE